MARDFVIAQPPRSPQLASYRRRLPRLHRRVRTGARAALSGRRGAARGGAHPRLSCGRRHAAACQTLSRPSIPISCSDLRIDASSLGRNRPLALSDRDDLGDEQRRAAARADRGSAAEDALVVAAAARGGSARACRPAARRSCWRSPQARRSAKPAAAGACRPQRFRSRRQSRGTDRLGHRARHRVSEGEAIMTAVSKPFPAATPSAILPVRMVRRAIARDGPRFPIGWSRSRRASFRPPCSGSRARPRSQAGSLKPSAIALFHDEYQAAADRSRSSPPMPPPVAEHLFPILLVIGLGVAVFGAGAAGHDRGDRDLRLSRRLADAWHVGGLLSAADRPGPGTAVA